MIYNKLKPTIKTDFLILKGYVPFPKGKLTNRFNTTEQIFCKQLTLLNLFDTCAFSL